MNAACPQCGYHWGANGPKDGQIPVPITDDPPEDVIGVLCFCSPECRDEYIEENDAALP